MATAAQIASPGVYVSDDVGLEVTDGSNSRVQLGLLPSGTYGLRVVTAGGSTVIIDGTSDMFKISATGTMTVSTAVGPASGTTNLVLSALGAQSVIPASLGFISNGNTNADLRAPGWLILRENGYVATSSGGAVTHLAGTLVAIIRLASYLDGSDLVNLDFGGDSFSLGAATFYSRYYVLAETAI